MFGFKLSHSRFSVSAPELDMCHHLLLPCAEVARHAAPSQTAGGANGEADTVSLDGSEHGGGADEEDVFAEAFQPATTSATGEVSPCRKKERLSIFPSLFPIPRCHAPAFELI